MLCQSYTIHFHDMCEWSNAFNFAGHISKVQNVVGVVECHKLLTDTEFRGLFRLPFDGPLPGFPAGISPPMLSSLHKLLDENWLGEHILDAYLHLISQQLNECYPNLILLLDSYFHLELSNGFANKQLSPILTQLHEKIIADPPHLVAFLINKDGVHWVGTTTVLEDHI